jgi:hypothetical protein
MGLPSGPLRAVLMSDYGLGKFKSPSELQLHAFRSSLSRLFSGTQKLDVQKSSTHVSPKAALSQQSTWRGLTKPLGGPHPSSSSAPGSAHDGASGSGTSGHGVSTRGRKKEITSA